MKAAAAQPAPTSTKSGRQLQRRPPEEISRSLAEHAGGFVDLVMADGEQWQGYICGCDEATLVLLRSSHAYSPSHLPVDEIERYEFREPPEWVVPWQLPRKHPPSDKR